MHYILETN